MRIGSAADHASWITMLPGCVIAGIGRHEYPRHQHDDGRGAGSRAGMASGIDMSARMISLALNIAAMGFVLVAGIVASLKGGVAGTIGDAARAGSRRRLRPAGPTDCTRSHRRSRRPTRAARRCTRRSCTGSAG